MFELLRFVLINVDDDDNFVVDLITKSKLKLFDSFKFEDFAITKTNAKVAFSLIKTHITIIELKLNIKTIELLLFLIEK